jgi:hypothetical protein
MPESRLPAGGRGTTASARVGGGNRRCRASITFDCPVGRGTIAAVTRFLFLPSGPTLEWTVKPLSPTGSLSDCRPPVRRLGDARQRSAPQSHEGEET